MSEEIFTHTMEQYHILLNNMKEITVHAMIKEGFITAEQGEEFIKSYAIVARAPGIFGQMYDKAFGKADKAHSVRYDVVKGIGVYGRIDKPVVAEPEDKPGRFGRLIPINGEKKDE